MAGKNQVTLTFAGDSAQLERTFDRVGDSAKSMSREVRSSADAFDRVGETADRVDTRAMGFRDTLTGLQDGFAGVRKVASGDLGFQSLLLLGFGIGDLASGVFNFLIPSLKSMVTWLKAGNLATVAHTVVSKAAALGSKIWAGAQWLLNAALTANPIGLIIAGIVALVAVIVLIATKTTWFQTIWRVVWGGIKDAALAVWNWLSGTLWPGIVGVFDKVVATFKAIPTAIKIAFSNLVDIILSPFRFAFNMVARAWNNTIGRLSWTVPDWVPFIGGKTFAAPKLPTFHTGGIVSGAMGTEVLAVLKAGERVTPAGGGGRSQVVELRVTGNDRAIVELVKRLVTVHGGGDVQAAFGR